MSFFVGDSGEDEFLLFEPLLEEELVCRVFGYLVEGVEGLGVHDGGGISGGEIGHCGFFGFLEGFEMRD